MSTRARNEVKTVRWVALLGVLPALMMCAFFGVQALTFWPILAFNSDLGVLSWGVALCPFLGWLVGVVLGGTVFVGTAGLAWRLHKRTEALAGPQARAWSPVALRAGSRWRRGSLWVVGDMLYFGVTGVEQQWALGNLDQVSAFSELWRGKGVQWKSEEGLFQVLVIDPDGWLRVMVPKGTVAE